VQFLAICHSVWHHATPGQIALLPRYALNLLHLFYIVAFENLDQCQGGLKKEGKKQLNDQKAKFLK